MAQTLTQKETAMLKDQLRHEEVCIGKYTGYAARTTDASLRGMFYEFAQDEQNHYNTINKLLGGTQTGAGTQGFATPKSPNSNQPSQSPTPRQPMSTEEFIEKAAEERLQSGIFGQHHKSKSRPDQGEGQSAYAGGQNPPGQPERQAQGGQQPQGAQQPQHAAQQPGAQAERQAGQQQAERQTGQQQAGLPGETSSELIPMFSTESAEEFAGGTGLGENESTVLSDMLMTEQFVSNAYDSAIFDTTNQQVRQALQHIQQDEQKHGQGIRDYMQRRGLN